MLYRAAPLVALLAVVRASLYGESNLNHTCQLRASLYLEVLLETYPP